MSLLAELLCIQFYRYLLFPLPVLRYSPHYVVWDESDDGRPV